VRQHVPVHEEEVFTRTVEVLAPPARASLGVTRAGLPAGAAQAVALVFVEPMPLVSGGVPHLVEQAVLVRYQPGQQRWRQRRDLACFGEGTLAGDEMVVRFSAQQWPIDTADTPAQGAGSRFAPTCPDLVEGGLQFMAGRRAIRRYQAPADLARISAHQLAQHPIARFVSAAQAFTEVSKTAQRAPGRADIEEHLHTLKWQAIEASLGTRKAQVPDAA